MNHRNISFLAEIFNDTSLPDGVKGCEICGLTDTGDDKVFEWYNYIINAICLPAIGTFGAIANIISFAIFNRPHMRNSANFYLAALAISDIFVVITAIFSFGFQVIRQYSDVVNSIFIEAVTTFYPLATMAQTFSVYLTVVAGIDCYIQVCQRRWAARHCRPSRACKIVVAVFIWSLCYNLNKFFEIRVEVCYSRLENTSRPQVCATPLRMNPLYVQLYYTIGYTIIMNAFPLVLLIVLNGNIIRKLSDKPPRVIGGPTNKNAGPAVGYRYSIVNNIAANVNAEHKKRLSHQPQAAQVGVKLAAAEDTTLVLNHAATTAVDPPGIGFHGSAEQQNKARIRRSLPNPFFQPRCSKASIATPKVPASSTKPAESGGGEALTLVMVVFLFIACNTMALIINFLELVPSVTSILSYFVDISNLLVVINSSINIVIYFSFSPDYRRELIRGCTLLWLYFCRLFSFTAKGTGVGGAGHSPDGNIAAAGGSNYANLTSELQVMQIRQGDAADRKIITTQTNHRNTTAVLIPMHPTGVDPPEEEPPTNTTTIPPQCSMAEKGLAGCSLTHQAPPLTSTAILANYGAGENLTTNLHNEGSDKSKTNTVSPGPGLLSELTTSRKNEVDPSVVTPLISDKKGSTEVMTSSQNNGHIVEGHNDEETKQLIGVGKTGKKNCWSTLPNRKKSGSGKVKDTIAMCPVSTGDIHLLQHTSIRI